MTATLQTEMAARPLVKSKLDTLVLALGQEAELQHSVEETH
jgi:hypothetical protein